MECNYEKCPAKFHIDDIKVSQDKYIGKVEYISNKLDVHASSSSLKHEQLLSRLDEIAYNHKSHTDEEMEVQKNFIKTIKDMSEALGKNTFRTNIMWSVLAFIATGLGGWAFYMLNGISLVIKG